MDINDENKLTSIPVTKKTLFRYNSICPRILTCDEFENILIDVYLANKLKKMENVKKD